MRSQKKPFKFEVGGAYRPNRSSAAGVINFNKPPIARMGTGGRYPNDWFGDKSLMKMGGKVSKQRPDTWRQAETALDALRKGSQKIQGKSYRGVGQSKQYQLGGNNNPVLKKGGRMRFKSKFSK
jgi:hypothetical protein